MAWGSLWGVAGLCVLDCVVLVHGEQTKPKR
jgi:hypothetical protein